MKNLVVECWDEFGQDELREMSFEEFKELSKDCYSISSSGLLDGGDKCDKNYIVLIIDGKLNKELLSYASHTSRETLIKKYSISPEEIANAIKKAEEFLEAETL